MSAPFMAIVAAGCSIWCPQPRPVFACSGHQRRPPCGSKLNPAICGAKNHSPLWPAQQLQCLSISSEDWWIYRMLDGKSNCRASWTHTCWICSCDSQRSEGKDHQIVCKDRALSSPQVAHPTSGAARGCPRSSCVLLLCWRLLKLRGSIDSHTNPRARELVSIPLQSLVKTTTGKSSQMPFLQLILISYTYSSGCLMPSGL